MPKMYKEQQTEKLQTIYFYLSHFSQFDKL